MAAAVRSLKVCPYEIFSPSNLNSREENHRSGQLLRVDFEELGVGYSDFHPLPVLANEGNLQFQHSLKLAALDARARRDNRSLFEGLRLPDSHYLIQDVSNFDPQKIKILSQEGFKFIKVKLGRESIKEQESLLKIRPLLLESGIKLRLDFNSSNSESQWKIWESWLSMNFAKLIDFVEDPLPWNEKLWEQSPLPLALDLEWNSAQNENLDFLNRIIWKPALGFKTPTDISSSRYIITHLMDHPIGQLSALYWASQQSVPTVGGFLNTNLQDSLGFSEELKNNGPQVIVPKGTGWGFDERLKSLEWRSF